MKKIILMVAIIMSLVQADRCHDLGTKSSILMTEGLEKTTVGERLDYFNAAIKEGIQAMFVCESESDKDVIEKGLNTMGTYVDTLKQFDRNMVIPKG